MWTRRATITVLLAGGVYLAAAYTGLGWLYVIDALLISLVISSFFLADWNLRHLKAERRLRPTASEGELVPVEIALTNEGRAPRLLVEVKDHFPGATEPSHLLAEFLAGGESLSQRYFSHCRRRGRHRFPALRLRSGGAFGLFMRSRSLPQDDDILIYPQVSPLAHFPIEATTGASNHPLRLPGTEAAFLWTREFRSGDPRRHIHWRSTARRGQLIVKQLAREQSQDLLLIIDAAQGVDLGEVGESTLDYVVRAASSLACHALEGQFGLELALPKAAGQGFERHRPTNRWQALELLAGVEARGDQPLEPMLRELRQGSKASDETRLVALLPNPRPEQAEALAALRREGNHPIAIIADVASFLPGAAPNPSPTPAFQRAGLPLYILRHGEPIAQCLAQPV